MKTIAISVIAAAMCLSAPAAASKADAPVKKTPVLYCGMVEINSRIPQKVCLPEEGWLDPVVVSKK
jgi:hypothetical protein